MLKISCLALVAIVAISWSHIEARHIRHHALAQSMLKRGTIWQNALSKRSTGDNEIDEIDDLSAESQQRFVKELVAGMLLLTAESSEQEALGEKFEEILGQKFDSMDDFGTALANAYEEVTGNKPDASDVSEE